MDPSVSLIEPWVDPPNTFRATDISQMYDVLIDNDLNMSYSVGIQPENSDLSFDIIVRNKTTNCDLLLSIDLPQHLHFLQYPQSPRYLQFIVNRGGRGIVAVGMNELFVKNHTISSSSPIDGEVLIRATPTVLLEPVFVRTDLPILSNGAT